MAQIDELLTYLKENDASDQAALVVQAIVIAVSAAGIGTMEVNLIGIA